MLLLLIICICLTLVVYDAEAGKIINKTYIEIHRILEINSELSNLLPDDITTDSRNSESPNTDIEKYLKLAAKKENLPVTLLRAIMIAESSGSPEAVSIRGAYGLFQISEIAARHYGCNRYDIKENILCGARIFRTLYDKYASIEKALWGYNAGPLNVDKGIMVSETRHYIPRVMKLWKLYDNAKKK